MRARELRLGAVWKDGPTTYKLLKKSPGSVTVEITRMVKKWDLNVMPYAEIEVEQTTRTQISGETEVDRA